VSAHTPENEPELLELIHSIDVRAPEELHRRTTAMIAEQAHRSKWKLGIPAMGGRLAKGGSTAIVAAAAVIVALLLSGGSSGGGSSPVSVHRAAALTLRAATMGAPGESVREPGRLTAAVEGVAFPNWARRFGWRASGSRSDRLGGRAVETVFYDNPQGQRLGYAILAGSPPALAGGVVSWRGGSPYRLLAGRDENIVVWLRDGHMCVVGGRGISSATLLRLASWDDPGAAA